MDGQQALAGRGYTDDGELNSRIPDDPLTPWNDGTWHLAIAGGEASVTSTQASADVTLNVKTLASLFTGFRSAHYLASWGLIEGEAEAIRRTARMFATPHRPHCPDSF
ncbi:MAG: sterol carrier protein domain-containing protein [Pseudomonadales bacterium]|nr:sterol carrier protein domain-containing protein [Pseudomonadales bacterium]